MNFETQLCNATILLISWIYLQTPLKTSNSIKPGRLDLTLREEVNVSFAGCGFLAIYHLGVATCLLRKGQHFISNVTRWGGSSAGAIAAAAMVCLPNKLGVSKSVLKLIFLTLFLTVMVCLPNKLGVSKSVFEIDILYVISNCFALSFYKVKLIMTVINIQTLAGPEVHGCHFCYTQCPISWGCMLNKNKQDTNHKLCVF